MTDQFPAFANLVAQRFQWIAKQPNVFVVDVEGDKLYEQYLAAFPSGTNPRFKERTEHDCSCCRQFVRRVGNVVAIVNNDLYTVWDLAVVEAPYPYNEVASFLRVTVSSADVDNLFRVSVKETSFGTRQSRSLGKDGSVLTWNHFYTDAIPANLRSTAPDGDRGTYRTTVQVFNRGLTELRSDAVDTVLSLIESNSLYRGEEHKRAVVEFQAAQKTFASLTGHRKQRFVWTNASGPAARFRNTVIGTLVQDISEGRDVEAAVASFEQKVAPTNYKRTTAVISPGMVKKAMETIAELGLEPALERRFARIEDVSVNDVLWVDGAARGLLKGGLADVLMDHATSAAPKNLDKEAERAEDIGLDTFVKEILPSATHLELLLTGAHLGNLVALTAPVHPEPRQLFRWDNDFAWSYSGNVADSIAERVKKAGGKVEGATLRVSLSWFNFDDLDLHIIEPQGRGVHVTNEIFFRNKRGWTGGVLDVDMNAGGPNTRQAVENIVWSSTVPDGAYKVVVHNYFLREASDVGFVVEVECAGKLSHFTYNKMVRSGQNIHVVTLHMRAGRVERLEMGDPGITASNISQDKWGLKTEQYAKVSAVTLSPNYWHGGSVGNKHTFFFLDGCKSDEPIRGIYNEFLHPRLEAHRKVFEVIGDKTKCQVIDNQLAGVGFSSTKKDSFVIKVHQGRKQRLFHVKVGA